MSHLFFAVKLHFTFYFLLLPSKFLNTMWYVLLGMIVGAFIYKKFFAFNKNYKQILEQGAMILDVRTAQEFAGGSIPGSTNIPLGELEKRVGEVTKQGKPVITCCASGIRSASALTILKKNGVTCYNGGGYADLAKKI
jgi:phage shock protein E